MQISLLQNIFIHPTILNRLTVKELAKAGSKISAFEPIIQLQFILSDEEFSKPLIIKAPINGCFIRVHENKSNISMEIKETHNGLNLELIKQTEKDLLIWVQSNIPLFRFNSLDGFTFSLKELPEVSITDFAREAK